jgi:transcriptional regulator with XRE-family HTH domain
MCVKEHIYRQLIAQRRKRGISQRELAARAGLRREKLSRIESQAQNIGLDELCRLLDAAGLELQVRERDPSRPQAAPAHPRALAPREFDQAAFIDGSRAKILSWGKVPR